MVTVRATITVPFPPTAHSHAPSACTSNRLVCARSRLRRALASDAESLDAVAVGVAPARRAAVRIAGVGAAVLQGGAGISARAGHGMAKAIGLAGLASAASTDAAAVHTNGVRLAADGVPLRAETQLATRAWLSGAALGSRWRETEHAGRRVVDALAAEVAARVAAVLIRAAPHALVVRVRRCVARRTSTIHGDPASSISRAVGRRRALNAGEDTVTRRTTRLAGPRTWRTGISGSAFKRSGISGSTFHRAGISRRRPFELRAIRGAGFGRSWLGGERSGAREGCRNDHEHQPVHRWERQRLPLTARNATRASCQTDHGRRTHGPLSSEEIGPNGRLGFRPDLGVRRRLPRQIDIFDLERASVA